MRGVTLMLWELKKEKQEVRCKIKIKSSNTKQAPSKARGRSVLNRNNKRGTNELLNHN